MSEGAHIFLKPHGSCRVGVKPRPGSYQRSLSSRIMSSGPLGAVRFIVHSRNFPMNPGLGSEMAGKNSNRAPSLVLEVRALTLTAMTSTSHGRREVKERGPGDAFKMSDP